MLFIWWEISCGCYYTLTVSSEHMADNWDPHMIAVNMPNNKPSNTRKIRNIVVAGGDTPEQSVEEKKKSQIL